jgi:hypothetical protein
MVILVAVLPILLPALGCGPSSSSSAVAAPGTWRLTIREMVDVEGPEYVQEVSVPELPDLTVRLVGDPMLCHDGCRCGFGPLQDEILHRDGPAGDDAKAYLAFTEVCASGRRVYCTSPSTIVFDDDEHGMGVCTDQEDLLQAAPYAKVDRYSVALARLSHD